ncbi:vWA domain-containing protein [Actinophytocola gossypii]|uniref:VWA domain-containing protein n=1 Tax=Actinophytocola gossypii TaxID=2812003 RepID=A0ABT2JK52_9PSEU|nr:VWA domain-containing protein [Actinophytocola gossypii]MCT2588270.1 VWA domain-containing protein [Actinophytocola gossypii]
MTSPGRATILPIYVVCDLSGSMRVDGRADAVRDALVALRDAVWLNPVVSDQARIGVVGFAGTATVLLPLCDLATVGELPDLEPGGLTSYGAAFRLLRETVRADTARLAADGYRVFRPLVFFVSDGEPTDRRPDWAAEHARLVGRDGPEIVAFAVGEARAATLAAVATSRCFVARTDVAVRDAIARIGDVVIRSVVASSVTGGQTVVGPAPGAFDELDLL